MIRHHVLRCGDYLDRVELADGTVIVMERHAALVVMMLRVVRVRVGMRAAVSVTVRTAVRMFVRGRNWSSQIEVDVRMVVLMQCRRRRRQQIAGERERRRDSLHQSKHLTIRILIGNFPTFDSAASRARSKYFPQVFCHFPDRLAVADAQIPESVDEDGTKHRGSACFTHVPVRTAPATFSRP